MDRPFVTLGPSKVAEHERSPREPWLLITVMPPAAPAPIAT